MRKRIAVIDFELCKPEKCDYLCARVCPINRSQKECVVINELTDKPVIDENLCIGCGICVKKCPFQAISVVNLPEKLEESPIHRYGKNDFALFRLPFPVKGEVVGLIGPNGVGKTTALLILSGKIKPNLGRVEEEVDYSEVIRTFRGTELQDYLTRLQEGEIKVALKPQRVDKIPEHSKGEVGDLLSNVDERGLLDRIVERLNIKSIMNRDISEVSGGELQRIAIAATLAKDADIYYFDEPTSFLDVFQRLETAKVIREFTKDKSCMVVDHDLATLDFLADRIHIFYGVPGVYGIVSKPYGVRVGINTFLDGYIKEDNVIIRKEPISFLIGIERKEVGVNVLVKFSKMKKRLGDFELVVEGGEVYEKEVLAILGQNALGKTTFARMLTGEVRIDEGSVDGEVKISYKPQYPKVEFQGTVEDFLKKECDSFDEKEFRNMVIIPLGLSKLMEKNVQNLSGGEFQRVVVASCLGKRANVYLLDEPSAYLDVEQRLALAKVIRRLVEIHNSAAIVIDHDLTFLSQIADRAMVFLGEPVKRGLALKPRSVKDAFNTFLKEVGVTFRKDPHTGRARANKLGSKLDIKQKEMGIYFYVS